MEHCIATHVIGSTDSGISQLSSIGLPGSDISFTGHLQVDSIDHDAVSSSSVRSTGIEIRRVVFRAISASQQTLVIGRIMLLMEPGRQSEIGQFDVTLSIDQDVVGLDVTE
jgi:hypothetical protein